MRQNLVQAVPAAPTVSLDPADGRARRRDAGHVRALFVQSPASLTGNLIGAVLVAGIFWPLAERGFMLAWLGGVATLWLLRLAHYLRFLRQRDTDDNQLALWRASWCALVLAQGSMWGVAAWLFWGLGTLYHQVSLILIVYSYCLGSVQLLATQWRIFLVFISLVLAPLMLRIASDGDQDWHLQLVLILGLLFGITVLMGRTYGSALAHAITLKARTDELAAQLRVEMQEAEDARRAAESASRAKTQFFAAASHDLRQPLHAMGLFAEALRQKNHDVEVAHLVNSINESDRKSVV